jgi:hypothetical protein
VALGVLLIPATSTIKDLLLLEITWIDPTLLVALLAIPFLQPSLRPMTALPLLATALASCIAGAATLPPQDSYSVIRETARLLMDLAWFYVVASTIRHKPALLLNVLSITVILQLLIAIVIEIVMGLSMSSLALTAIQDYYGSRQLIWFGDFPLQRLMGTFFEGPAFGLFMMCSLVVLLVGRLAFDYRTRLCRCAMGASILGTLGSFSDQILLACMVLITGFWLRWIGKRKRSATPILVGAAALALVTISILPRMSMKLDEIAHPEAVVEAGSSGGERMYHVRLSTEAWTQDVCSFLLGIGPGRYGSYAAHQRVFPPTVTIQFTADQWLTEYGVVGATVIAIWLASIYSSARKIPTIGAVGFVAVIIAAQFQANWNVPSFFTALAVLYSVGLKQRPPVTTATAVPALELRDNTAA